MSDARSKRIIDNIIELSKHCRKCKHMRLSHMEGTHCVGTRGNREKLLICNCKEYVPEDNLDYIEWMAKKRGFIK